MSTERLEWPKFNQSLVISTQRSGLNLQWNCTHFNQRLTYAKCVFALYADNPLTCRNPIDLLNPFSIEKAIQIWKVFLATLISPFIPHFVSEHLFHSNKFPALPPTLNNFMAPPMFLNTVFHAMLLKKIF